jgi:hypothetical protein
MMECGHNPSLLLPKRSRRSGWSALKRTAAIATIATLVAACNNRTSSVEDIILRDGKTQRIELLATRGTDILGEKAPTDKVEVQFERNQYHYHWQLERLPGQDWVSRPDIVDFVEGKPVVVFPVYRRPGCEAWGFPAEGLVAQRFNGQSWVRIPIAELPADLQTNRRSEMTANDPRSGKSLAEMVAFYSEYDDSCAEMHPAPATSAALSALVEVVEESPIGVVEPVAMADIPPTKLDRLLAASKRRWSKGYIEKACASLIDEIDGFAVLTGRIRAVDELRWVARDGKRKRVQVPQGFLSVFCDGDSVYVVTQQDPSEMVWVLRYSRDAAFRDVVRFSVKGMRNHTPGVVAAVSFDSGRIFFLWSASRECMSVADSSCHAYSVRLPAIEGG